jgi:hypothetical protein
MLYALRTPGSTCSQVRHRAYRGRARVTHSYLGVIIHKIRLCLSGCGKEYMVALYLDAINKMRFRLSHSPGAGAQSPVSVVSAV